MRPRARQIAAVALLLGACGGAGSEVSSLVACPVGDPTAAPAVELLTRDADGASHVVGDGDALSLVAAPQGGFVLLAGVRAHGLDGCALAIDASVRDEQSGRVVSIESRPVLLADGGDGWGEPNAPSQLTNFANLAMCPNGALDDDIGAAYHLTVTATDRFGRTASVEREIHMTCDGSDADTRASCACLCQPHHRLGDSC